MAVVALSVAVENCCLVIWSVTVDAIVGCCDSGDNANVDSEWCCVGDDGDGDFCMMGADRDGGGGSDRDDDDGETEPGWSTFCFLDACEYSSSTGLGGLRQRNTMSRSFH
jgi:hypothetical protein